MKKIRRFLLLAVIIIIAVSAMKRNSSGKHEEEREVSQPKTTQTIQQVKASDPVITPDVTSLPVSDDVPVEEKETENKVDQNEIRPEVKKAIDSYIEYLDEYIAFMEKYKENSTDASLLLQYASMLSKYAELTEDFEAIEDMELTDAETVYYAQASLEASQKMLKAAS